MLEREILICEFLAVDGLSTTSVAAGEITTLEHELWDYAVKRGAFVAISMDTRSQLAEIFGSLGHDIIV